MKPLLILVLTFQVAATALAQRPGNGNYKFHIAYWEWGDKPKDLICEVVIRGDSIFVINKDPAAENPDGLIDAGVLMLHKKSGKWIIGHKPEDRHAPKVGGCEEGPTVIDFKKKQVWLC